MNHAQGLMWRPGRSARWLVGWLAGSCCLGGSLLCAQVDRSWPMFQDPSIVVAEMVSFYDAPLLELWGQALDRPEEELRRQVLTTLITAADRGLSLASAQVGRSDLPARLSRLLADETQPLPLRQLAAEALVVLGAPLDGPALLETVDGLGAVRTAEVVDRRLGQEAMAVGLTLAIDAPQRQQIGRLLVAWARRAGDTGQPVGARVSALRQVAQITALLGPAGQLGLPQGYALTEQLQPLLAGDAGHPVTVRLAAAAALATADPAAAQAAAGQLQRTTRTERLLAAELLAGAGTPERPAAEQAAALLRDLAVLDDREVAGTAVRVLARVAPAAVEVAWGQGPNEQVRQAVIIALRTRLQAGDAARIPELGQMLSDEHPEVRQAARAALASVLGDPAHVLHRAVAEWCRQLPAEVRASVLGLEQAALLTAQVGLTAQPAWLTEALRSSVSAVTAAAAQATHAIGDAAVVPVAEELVRATAAPSHSAEEKVATTWVYLVSFLGAREHAAVSDLFRPWIAKNAPVAVMVRAAGIEALGRIHAGSGDGRLLTQLNGRLMDLTSEEPESLEVQWACAIAMGRIGGPAAANHLRQALASTFLPPDLEATSAWALSHITGQAVPVSSPPPRPSRGWFLEPLR